MVTGFALGKQGTVLFCKSSCVTVHCRPMPQFPVCTVLCDEGELTHLADAEALQQQGQDGRQTDGTAE